MKKVFSLILMTIFLVSVWSFNGNRKLIIIDAGHGGNDAGATVQEVQEKQITLAVAEKIKALNTKNDVEILLVRNDDSYPTLQKRVDFINSQNADLVISIHTNFSSKQTERRGIEIFCQNTEASENAAKKLSQKFSGSTVSEQPFKLLRESKAPALLLELGYLSNAEDRDYLSSKSGQKELAQKILDFVYEY